MSARDLLSAYHRGWEVEEAVAILDLEYVEGPE